MPISSPFESVHERLGANFDEYDGWQLPSDYGNTDTERKALREGCGAFDLSSFGKIRIKGPDSQVLLDVLINNKEKLADGKWKWGSIQDKQASQQDIIRIGKDKGVYTIFTMPASRQKVLGLAEQLTRENHLNSIQIADITEKTGMLALYGPNAIATVANILPFNLTALKEQSIMSISFFMITVMIIRGSWLGGEGLELLCPLSACAMAAGAVERYRKREKIVPTGMECLQAAMVDQQGDLEAQANEGPIHLDA